MRTVICHYHIFKNSGTSFDSLLAKNYGNKLLKFDGPFSDFIIYQDQLHDIILRNKEIFAFSSHQIQLPVPVSLNFIVLPTIFIRHPLLRIHSIYQFKRKINDNTLTSKNANSMSFDEWIQYSLSHPGEVGHISNAQTAHNGGVYGRKSLQEKKSRNIRYNLPQAKNNISRVPLLARTEYFSEDVAAFSTILKNRYDINFNYAEIEAQNVTSQSIKLPMEERLRMISDSLRKETYEAIIQANDQDLELFAYTGRIVENRFR